MSTPKILAFSGSLRQGSFNQRMVKVAAEGARNAGAEVTVISLRDFPLPFMDEDLEKESGLPENAKKLKDLFKSHHGVLLASPEYNGSVSGVLKNAIDWVSRPLGDDEPLEAFGNKVWCIMSASPGGLGGIRGLIHLRALLGGIRVHVIPQQHAMGGAGNLFDDSGNLTDAKQRETVQGLGKTIVQVCQKLNA
ncbi:MAG: NADPH-dependent FMN reductase [Phycisphaerales bacterium]